MRSHAKEVGFGSNSQEQRASLPRPFIPQLRPYVTNRHEVREVPIAVEPDSLSSGFLWQSRHNAPIARRGQLLRVPRTFGGRRRCRRR